MVSSPAAEPVSIRTLVDAERAHITAVLSETGGLEDRGEPLFNSGFRGRR